MKSFIKHIVFHLPTRVDTNEYLQEQNPDWNVDDLYKLTGVRTRYIAAANETPSDLAVHAGEKLFESFPEEKNKIDFILFCTQSNDYVTPTTACVIQDRLQLPVSAGAIDFNQGCSGFVYGLALADGLIKSGTAKNVLLLTAETISRYINDRDKGTRFLFGDAASATLITGKPELGSFEIGPFILGTDGSGFQNIIIKYGCARHALADASDEEFVDEFGNVRTEKNFYMNGNAVFLFSIRTVPKMVQQLLDKSGLSIEEIDYFIFHQANKIILDSIRKKMKIPEEKMVYCIEDYGNTVSSAIPIALVNSGKKGLFKKNQKILLAAFGVGYSWSATIVEMN